MQHTIGKSSMVIFPEVDRPAGVYISKAVTLPSNKCVATLHFYEESDWTVLLIQEEVFQIAIELNVDGEWVFVASGGITRSVDDVNLSYHSVIEVQFDLPVVPTPQIRGVLTCYRKCACFCEFLIRDV